MSDYSEPESDSSSSKSGSDAGDSGEERPGGAAGEVAVSSNLGGLPDGGDAEADADPDDVDISGAAAAGPKPPVDERATAALAWLQPIFDREQQRAPAPPEVGDSEGAAQPPERPPGAIPVATLRRCLCSSVELREQARPRPPFGRLCLPAYWIGRLVRAVEEYNKGEGYPSGEGWTTAEAAAAAVSQLEEKLETDGREEKQRLRERRAQAEEWRERDKRRAARERRRRRQVREAVSPRSRDCRPKLVTGDRAYSNIDEYIAEVQAAARRRAKGKRAVVAAALLVFGAACVCERLPQALTVAEWEALKRHRMRAERRMRRYVESHERWLLQRQRAAARREYALWRREHTVGRCSERAARWRELESRLRALLQREPFDNAPPPPVHADPTDYLL